MKRISAVLRFFLGAGASAKALGVAALFSVGVLFMGAVSPLDMAAKMALQRVADMTSLFLRLNGTPVALGVLTSTGTSVDDESTAVPFTFVGGSCYEVTCDGAAVLNIGGTASTDYTSANFGHAMTGAGVPWYVCVRDADTDISLDTTGGTVNCNVRSLR